MKQFKLSIPKPCHEDWNTMTPNEKGKFCASCSKTVVDFTQKSTQEIKEYLLENHGKRVCGHFYRKQLDSIVLQIPETTFQQELSFQKLFILILLLVMGTTLFSCKTDSGKVQKIEKVELIDSITKTEKAIDSINKYKKQDSIIVNKKKLRVPPPPPTPTGIVVIETTGEVVEEQIDSIGNDIEEIEGELIIDTVVGDIEETNCSTLENDFFYFGIIENPPRFKKDKNVSKEEAEEVFHKRIKKYAEENFDTEMTKNLGLSKGKYKIYAQFVIDTSGKVSNIEIRAPHEVLKKEAQTLIEKLPQFIPGENKGKKVSTKYTLPISFVIE